MILHTVSMVAVFVDQVTQAPAAVQCQPNAGQDQDKRILISERMEQVVIVPTGFKSFSVGTAF